MCCTPVRINLRRLLMTTPCVYVWMVFFFHCFAGGEEEWEDMFLLLDVPCCTAFCTQMLPPYGDDRSFPVIFPIFLLRSMGSLPTTRGTVCNGDQHRTFNRLCFCRCLPTAQIVRHDNCMCMSTKIVATAYTLLLVIVRTHLFLWVPPNRPDCSR